VTGTLGRSLPVIADADPLEVLLIRLVRCGTCVRTDRIRQCRRGPDSVEYPSDDDVPDCFHLDDNSVYTRSPRIPVNVEGVRVPMVLDTGAEVTILSSDFMRQLFPGQDLPD